MKSKKVTHNPFSHLKYGVLLSLGLFPAVNLDAQSAVYDDFDNKTSKVIRYGERGGVLDTVAKDPSPKDVNKAGKCALYIRNGAKKFDNIKMGLMYTLTDVDMYSTYLGIPPKLKMKIYTSAPPGTLVEILLGSKRGNNDYPAGTHSQYQAYTTVSNQWEQLEFKFSQIPQGSETSTTQIDQITLLFNPNSSNSDTYYFDELTGPPLSNVPSGSNKVAPGSGMNNNAQDMKGSQDVKAAETAKPVSTSPPTNKATSAKPTKTKKTGK